MSTDRDGWRLTGALAALPSCPPFPQFTDFEAHALNDIATAFGADAPAFRAQVAVAQVIDRINTIHGFYTRVRVDRTACDPVTGLRLKGGHFDVEDLEHGLGVILWDKDGSGYLETIEAFGYTREGLEGHDLERLKYTGLIQLG
jgi:hypothetical protein